MRKNLRKRLLTGFSFISISAAFSILITLDSNIHKLCLETDNYINCIRSYKKRYKATRKNVIANTCPSNYAYDQDGVCRKVICISKFPFLSKGHKDLTGKGWKCNSKSLFINNNLQWSSNDQPKRAYYSNECPSRAVKKGWQSTCHEEDGFQRVDLDIKRGGRE